MAYVDGFLLPVPKRNVAAYRRIAQRAGKIWRELGALEYRECAGDDLKNQWGASFPKVAKAKSSETVFFSYVVYKSRAHRDSVNKKLMKDPRMVNLMKGKPPFDVKRMAYGGFRVVVDA